MKSKSTHRLRGSRNGGTSAANKQIGMTMIEVLVSILVFSIGVIGLVGLQARATQFSVDAEDRTTASLLANDAISIMWGQHTGSLSSADLTAWQSRVSSRLPNGSGTISGPTSGITTVTITWKAPNKNSTVSSNQYFTQVNIR